MREIKFRGFDESDNSGMYNFIPLEDMIKDGITVMQYTGLKDKKWTDIYEGDIAKADYIYSKLTICEWDKELLRYVFRSLNGSRLDELPLTIHTREEFEIIGNIYENPELCKD